MKQPHHGLLTVVVSKCLPSRGEETYGVGLQELALQQLIARGLDRHVFKENLFVPICRNSRLKTQQTCLRTVTSSCQYDSNTRILSKVSDLRLSYHARNSFLSRHLSRPNNKMIYQSGAYVIVVFLGIKVVGYHDLVAFRPKASGSSRSAHGRKDRLSKILYAPSSCL